VRELALGAIDEFSLTKNNLETKADINEFLLVIADILEQEDIPNPGYAERIRRIVRNRQNLALNEKRRPFDVPLAVPASTEDIKRWVKECIEHLDANKEKKGYWATSGDCFVYVWKEIWEDTPPSYSIRICRIDTGAIFYPNTDDISSSIDQLIDQLDEIL